MITTSDKWCSMRYSLQSRNIRGRRYGEYVSSGNGKMDRMQWWRWMELKNRWSQLQGMWPSRLQRPLGPSSAGNKLFQYMHGASLSIAVLEALRHYLYSGVDHHQSSLRQVQERRNPFVYKDSFIFAHEALENKLNVQ